MTCWQALSSTQRPMGMINPVSSAMGMKSTGGMFASLLVVPTQQRLEPGDLIVDQRQDGLVVQVQLVVLQGLAQVVFQLQTLVAQTRSSGLNSS